VTSPSSPGKLNARTISDLGLGKEGTTKREEMEVKLPDMSGFKSPHWRTKAGSHQRKVLKRRGDQEE